MAGVEKFLWKLVGVSTSLVAAKVGRSVLDKGWSKARGGEPPRNPAAAGTSWREALQWAVASGVAVAVTRLIATRGMAGLWRAATGHLPPGLEEVGN